MLAISPQNKSRLTDGEIRAWHDAVNRHGPEHQRHDGARGHAQCQQWDERGLGGRIVRGFGGGDALDRPAAKT